MMIYVSHKLNYYDDKSQNEQWNVLNIISKLVVAS